MLLSRLFKNRYCLPVVVFLLTLLPRAINLFGYPYFENDEGVYTSQGWWLINFGKLAPYTYWYDHAPFGWLTIGLWQKLTGGPFSFGFSLFSTRIFMTLVVSFTSVLIYEILLTMLRAKREVIENDSSRSRSNNKWIAFIACVALAFSPLAVTYGRRVLLDNLETFWLILSILLLIKAKSRLNYIFFSTIFFGLSFLSKEAVIFLVPVMLYAIWLETSKSNRRFGLLIWLATASFLIGLFPLLALLKTEFFPVGWFGSADHVSLLQTILYQMGRGSELQPWQQGSPILTNIQNWFSKDFIFMALGCWAIGVNTLINWKNKQARVMVLLALFYFLFLARGGLVLEFYVLPLLALLTINMGLAMATAQESFNKSLKFLFSAKSLGVLAIILGFVLIRQDIAVYTAHPTQKQLQAVAYAKEKLTPEDFIVIDDFAFMDFRLAKNSEAKVFPNAEWFWKVEDDPAIRDTKLKGDWRNIDYVLLSGEMRRQMLQGQLPLIQKALVKATIVQDFPSDDLHEQGDMADFSREGDGWATLFKIGAVTNVSLDNFGALVRTMPLEQKVGSLFMVGIEGTSLDEETKKFLQRNYFSNFLLLQRNIDNEDQVKKLTEELRQTNDTNEGLALTKARPLPTALIAVDEEGGSVNRIKFSGIDLTPQSEINDTDEARRVAANRAEVLKNLGINVNLAPVLDSPYSKFSYISRTGRAFVVNQARQGVSEPRSEEVAKLAGAMMEEYQKQGILPVVKHYPFGLGRTVDDPHLVLPTIDISLDDLANDLVVLKKLLEVDNPKAIMASHLLYPVVDSQLPSSLSPIFISKILRRELGFQGVVASDDLSMGAITSNFQIEEAAKLALKAGVDLIIISSDPIEQQKAYETVLEAVRTGEITEGRIDEALERINKIRD